MKSDLIRRFLAHDFLQVGFTLQTSRTNNKHVISTFRVFPEPRFSGGQLTTAFENQGSMQIFEGQLGLTPSS